MNPADLLLIVMLGALTLYALLAGADFGAGVWEISTVLTRNERERQLAYKAIGPVWEANHVWLIFVLVILLNGFPVAFAILAQELWMPLLLALTGIVFRGASYIFRSYGDNPPHARRFWEALFALASTASPLFLGAAAGAIASGRLASLSLAEADERLFGWFSPLAAYTGVYSVGMCAYLAAVYLTREAEFAGDQDLRATWRWRALVTGLWLGLLSAGGLVLAIWESPMLARGFRDRAWPLVVISLLSGTVSLAAIARQRTGWAVMAAAGAVTSVLWGWGIAQYPFLVPPDVSAHLTQAPDNVLWLMLAVIALGTVLLLPALVYLMVLFKTQQRSEHPPVDFTGGTAAPRDAAEPS